MRILSRTVICNQATCNEFIFQIIQTVDNNAVLIIINCQVVFLLSHTLVLLCTCIVAEDYQDDECAILILT